MTVQIPSANTLLDQTFFSQVATDINSLNDKVSRTSSQIYNTATSARVTSFTGSFSISTNQISISHTLSKTAPTTATSTEAVAFGITFIANPIVVATIESTAATATSGANSSATTLLANVSVQNVSTSGCNVYVTLNQNDAIGPISYKVNVIAIGLVQA